MVRILFITFLCFVFAIDSNANPAYAYRIRFKDKNGGLTIADSIQFLSSKSLQRRSKQGISLDSTDLPLVPSYILAVVNAGNVINVHNRSKWFNQIVVILEDSTKVNDILALPMVLSAKFVGFYPTGDFKTATDFPDKYGTEIGATEIIEHKTTRGSAAYYGSGFKQIDMIQGDCIHDLGFKGEGMDIAIFDSGFRGTPTCSFLSTMFTDGRMKSQYDFARDTADAFAQTIISQHGINVLSTMASNTIGTYVGSAPASNYFLYVTEDTRFEMPIEEDNWLSAAEYSDSAGVDLINSSVIYNEFMPPFASYTYNDMDGNTSLIAKAANMAVQKGIFVVVAQGNEGISPWKYLSTPADADSVYSVGSIDSLGKWTISGYGPNSAGVIKPDGVGLGKGVAILSNNCILSQSNGSSFAAPVIAGSIACLWQSLPNLSNWELRQLIRISSDKYSTPTDTLGYGLPNLCLARNIALGNSEVQHIEFKFAVFPNPLSESFLIKSFIPIDKYMSYELYDMQGRLVSKSNPMVVNEIRVNALASKPAGNYVCIIYANNKKFQTILTRK